MVKWKKTGRTIRKLRAIPGLSPVQAYEYKEGTPPTKTYPHSTREQILQDKWLFIFLFVEKSFEFHFIHKITSVQRTLHYGGDSVGSDYSEVPGRNLKKGHIPIKSSPPHPKIKIKF